MYTKWLVSAILCSLAPPVLATVNSPFFRPANATAGKDVRQLYKWTGSYYNGTAEVEFTTTGRDIHEKNWDQFDDYCSSYLNKTVKHKFRSIFAVLPAVNGSESAAPVNAAWTFWKEDDDLSRLTTYTGPWYDKPGHSFSGPAMAEVFSFNPQAANNTDHDIQTIPFKISDAHDGHYNVSAKVAKTGFVNPGFYKVDACEGAPNMQNAWIDEKAPSNPPATFAFEFDHRQLNASLELPHAYIRLAEMDAWGFYGKMKMTLTGAKVDTWHSDTLIGGASPSWNSTVGYDNNYWGYHPENTTAHSNGAVDRLSYSGVLSALAGLGSATFLLI